MLQCYYGQLIHEFIQQEWGCWCFFPSSRSIVYGFLDATFPIFQPHPRKVLTILGVIAKVIGIRIKKSDLCTP